MGMDASAMNAPMAKALTLTPTESSASLCNCGAVREVSAPVMIQEVQELAAPAASSLNLVLPQTDLAQFVSDGYRTPRLRVFSCNFQSVLCTFQI
jgi:hypothetical protein